MANTEWKTSYFRKDGSCIRRTSPTQGTVVITPDDPKDKLPLTMSTVTFPTAQRFDDHIKEWEEVDISCFENYVYSFIGRVERDISEPMTRMMIERQLAMTGGLLRK